MYVTKSTPLMIEAVMLNAAKNNRFKAAGALAALLGVSSNLGWAADARKTVDDEVDYICKVMDNGEDLCQNDYGAMLRTCAGLLNAMADNERDEKTTTEVYR